MKAIIMDRHGGLEVSALRRSAGSGRRRQARSSSTSMPPASTAPTGRCARAAPTPRSPSSPTFPAGISPASWQRSATASPTSRSATRCSACWPPGREGTYCEKVAEKAAICAKKPDSLSHVDAAALALIGLTALVSIEDTLKLKSGETILIQGGAGGVASFAIQLAKHIGARVITTASAANHAYVKSLGADQVIDYAKQDFTKVVSGRRRGVRHRRRRRGQCARSPC